MSDRRRQHGVNDDDLLPDGLRQDPYDILGVPFEASEADIKKAYRKKALILHPDKQQPAAATTNQQTKNKSSQSPEELAKAFHELQLARSFLLDAEHNAALQSYRRKLASRRARQQADHARDQNLSESRKRMRRELQEREERVRRKQQSDSTTSARSSRTAQEYGDDDDAAAVEQLQRQGREMREQYGKRRDDDDAEMEQELRRRQRDDKERHQLQLENRQVRLKWSRKKMDPPNPTESALADLMKAFGEVESVELLGNKGNSALVTFRHEPSCASCVQHYAESDVLRASFVGKRKEQEAQQDDQADVSAAMKARRREEGGDTESMEDREMRRAAEREEIMRQMKEEEDDHPNGGEVKSKAEMAKVRKASGPYPPPLPSQNDDDYLGLSDPLHRLERVEELLLQGIVPDDVIRGLKVANLRREPKSISAGIVR